MVTSPMQSMAEVREAVNSGQGVVVLPETPLSRAF